VLYPAADRALGYAGLRGRLGDSIRRWFVCGPPVLFSSTWGILETNRIGATRPLEAMLVGMCYASKGFSMSVLPLPAACPA
jgi:hypothetical protein